MKEIGYHSVWKIIEAEKRESILTNKLELHIIQLPKIEGEEDKNDKLLDWLYFLENPKSERVIEKMEENKDLKEAGEKLDGLSADERMQRIAELREKAIMDEKAIYRKGTKDGVRQEKREAAKKMLKAKIDIKLITEITELSEEEIKNL